jgi:predicted phosphoribosyltransferase
MSESSRFRDRREAGRLLAHQLGRYKDRGDVTVLALPRGGVPVGYEIAQELRAPLDVFVVRKLGVPWQPELAMGAIAGDGIEVLNGDVVSGYNIPLRVIHAVAEREAAELQRQLQQYRGDRPFSTVTGRAIVLVDDGLATGSTMKAAIKALRHEHPSEIIVAVPVAARETRDDLRPSVEDIVCLLTPENFLAVGLWYDDFSQTTDHEVRQLLGQAAIAQAPVH